MKGRDFERSAFNETTERVDRWEGAKAEADARRAARAAYFIIVDLSLVQKWVPR